MAGLLSGLEQFGLGGLESEDIYEKKKEGQFSQDGQPAAQEKKDPLQLEMETLLEKSYTCPVCDNKFKQKSIRGNKTRLLETDLDLRPRYENVDTLKYDVVLCPKCGYAALGRYFTYMTPAQAKLIREKISTTFRFSEPDEPVYSYETALARYKLALANAIVRKSKASERAYICLRAGWLMRGMAESLDSAEADYEKKKAEVQAAENEFLKNAFDGFITARQTEAYPMCGMEKHTVDYLLAVLAIRFEEYDIASKLISGILISKNASQRMKDKAHDIKEILLEKRKASKEAK
ncbi:MAG: DUF2225 domain-containing protein [Lachnospiraceae bacterium]|nr:DUF2225 domain-containing protein [Lachnospiraceae bacterium]